MTLYALKPRFQALLRPLVARLAAAGVTANQVTVAAALLSIAAGAAVALYPEARAVFLLLPLVLFVRMALNAIDGMLAREHGQKSALGGVLNELTDVISDAVLYVPFAFLPGFEPALVVTVVILATLTEMTGVVCVQIGASRRYDGPFGKSDRAFVFGAMGVAIGLGVATGPWVTWVLVAMITLSAATVVNRARRGLREIRR